jgi:hypothetical protein
MMHRIGMHGEVGYLVTDDQDEQDESPCHSGELNCSVLHTFTKGSNNLCHGWYCK